MAGALVNHFEGFGEAFRFSAIFGAHQILSA